MLIKCEKDNLKNLLNKIEIKLIINTKLRQHNNQNMNKPQVKVNNIQVNIKAPQQLHVVRPHSAKKSRSSSRDPLPQSIKQQASRVQQQQLKGSRHKIRHIESLQDKRQFVDQTNQQRVAQSDEARESISRAIHPQVDLPTGQIQLEKIAEQAVNQEQPSKPLKHIMTVYDKDEFNLRNSREKQTQRKRRLSQSNVETYIQSNNRLSVVGYLSELQKEIPEKIVEEELQLEKKQGNEGTPGRRPRRGSVHNRSRSREGVSQEIQRMIVDEVDKKKKPKKQEDFEPQQKLQTEMESIKEEKQQDDNVNTCRLQEARERIQEQIQSLAKVVGPEIGPGANQHLFFEKQQSILEEQVKDEKDD